MQEPTCCQMKVFGFPARPGAPPVVCRGLPQRIREKSHQSPDGVAVFAAGTCAYTMQEPTCCQMKVFGFPASFCSPNVPAAKTATPSGDAPDLSEPAQHDRSNMMTLRSLARRLRQDPAHRLWFAGAYLFKVVKESAEDFEQVWLGRDSHLGEMEGFVEFHMLKGPEAEDHIIAGGRDRAAWCRAPGHAPCGTVPSGSTPRNRRASSRDRRPKTTSSTPRTRSGARAPISRRGPARNSSCSKSSADSLTTLNRFIAMNMP
jgi:hypothetical protein